MTRTEEHLLAEQIGKHLKARHWTLALAESATGGLLGTIITQISGSSAYFMGGIIAYDDMVKSKLLDVREESLQRWGAVSARVALEMATGAQARLQTTVALSITGIAGPTGATPYKPVGLAYVGMAMPRECWVWRVHSSQDRNANNHAFAKSALQHLHNYLVVGRFT